MRFLYDLSPAAKERLIEVWAERLLTLQDPWGYKAPRALCGTWTGYKRHHREGTTPCRGCKDAAAARERERRRRHRESVA